MKRKIFFGIGISGAGMLAAGVFRLLKEFVPLHRLRRQLPQVEGPTSVFVAGSKIGVWLLFAVPLLGLNLLITAVVMLVADCRYQYNHK